MNTSYEVRPGPEHFLPPAAASMGVRLPDPGQAILYGHVITQEMAFRRPRDSSFWLRCRRSFPAPWCSGHGMRLPLEKPGQYAISMKRLSPV